MCIKAACLLFNSFGAGIGLILSRGIACNSPPREKTPPYFYRGSAGEAKWIITFSITEREKEEIDYHAIRKSFCPREEIFENKTYTLLWNDGF